MSTLARAVVEPLKYQSSSQGVAEPFLADVEEVFSALDGLLKEGAVYEDGEPRPSPDNVAWAKDVLLKILPRHLLRGAEIAPYYGEIHATWDGENKRVVAYFPKPAQLKVYYEQLKDGAVACHDLKNTDTVGLSGILRWFFQK
jgi:hypothetical protein